MKFLVVLCLFSLYSLTSGQGAQKFCGRHLARTLADLCSEVEYENMVKRSGVDSASLHSTRGWSWAALKSARGKRGVIEECCERACTLDELLTYC